MNIKKYLDYLKEYCPVGDGWKSLVISLCENIITIDDTVEVLQVKEKYGGLSFFIGAVDRHSFDKIYDFIDQAEKESYTVCENCGTKENVETKGDWLLTLCDSCRKERKSI